MHTVWKNDLPELLGPMTTKELRQSMRRGSFVIPFLLIQVLAVIATVLEFQRGEVSKISGDKVGMLNIELMWASGPFWAIVAAVCIVVMPLGGIVLMGQELEEGNHELLLLTKLGRWKIVMGKFLSLWGLCVLTFCSLLPFVVVRYVLGEVEWWYELACSATVIGASALACGGVIGASSFKTIAGRVGILIVYLGSLAFAAGVSLTFSAFSTKERGWIYHITAISVVICYVCTGLALARSRLRLVVLAYEVKPSGMIVAQLILMPFALALMSLITVGHAGFIGFFGMTLVALGLDVSPKAPKWVKPAVPNIPIPPSPSAVEDPPGGPAGAPADQPTARLP